MLLLAESGTGLETLPKDLVVAIEAGRIPGSVITRFLEFQKSAVMRWLMQLGGFRERLLADGLFLAKLAMECGVVVFTKLGDDDEEETGAGTLLSAKSVIFGSRYVQSLFLQEKIGEKIGGRAIEKSENLRKKEIHKKEEEQKLRKIEKRVKRAKDIKIAKDDVDRMWKEIKKRWNIIDCANISKLEEDFWKYTICEIKNVLLMLYHEQRMKNKIAKEDKQEVEEFGKYTIYEIKNHFNNTFLIS